MIKIFPWQALHTKIKLLSFLLRSSRRTLIFSQASPIKVKINLYCTFLPWFPSMSPWLPWLRSSKKILIFSQASHIKVKSASTMCLYCRTMVSYKDSLSISPRLPWLCSRRRTHKFSQASPAKVKLKNHLIISMNMFCCTMVSIDITMVTMVVLQLLEEPFYCPKFPPLKMKSMDFLLITTET